MTDMDNTTAASGIILKTDSLGRVKLPREKREELLAEYARSGMSGRAFAKWAGVKYQTFATWVQQRRQAGAGAAKVRWVEARLPELPQPPSGGPILTIELPGGAQLMISGIGQVPLAAELLRQLGAAC